MSLQDVQVEADVVNRPPTPDTREGLQEGRRKNSIVTNASEAESTRTSSGGVGMPPLHSSRSSRGLGRASPTAPIPNQKGPLSKVFPESPRSELPGLGWRHCKSFPPPPFLSFWQKAEGDAFLPPPSPLDHLLKPCSWSFLRLCLVLFS